MTSSAKHRLTRLRTLGPVVLTLLVIGGAWADKVAFHTPQADSAPYHAGVQVAAAQVPYNIGAWLGKDIPVPASAVALLKPNVILSRQYQHVRSGRTASLLVVHCQDARDLIGHYPPVCYAAQGWSKTSALRSERRVGERLVPVMDYAFKSRRIDRSSELRIDNFMVLPDGQFCHDMAGVEDVAQDYRRKFFGAAQVQLVTDGSWSDADRHEFFRDMISAAEPLLDVIRNGVTQ